jgi:hypothetical protein
LGSPGLLTSIDWVFSEEDTVPTSGNKRRAQKRKMVRRAKSGNRKQKQSDWRRLKPERPTICGILELLGLIEIFNLF